MSSQKTTSRGFKAAAHTVDRALEDDRGAPGTEYTYDDAMRDVYRQDKVAEDDAAGIPDVIERYTDAPDEPIATVLTPEIAAKLGLDKP